VSELLQNTPAVDPAVHQSLSAGFFLGDGAGVGKGRQIAGIIADNYARGRGRSLWFSMNSDLLRDAERDLADVGARGVSVIDGCNSCIFRHRFARAANSVMTRAPV